MTVTVTLTSNSVKVVYSIYKNNGSEGFVPDPNYNSTDDYRFHQNDINGDGFDSMSVLPTD